MTQAHGDALLEAAEYFEGEAAEWREVGCGQHPQNAVIAIEQAERFEGYAKAIRRTTPATQVEPDAWITEYLHEPSGLWLLNDTHSALSDAHEACEELGTGDYQSRIIPLYRHPGSTERVENG